MIAAMRPKEIPSLDGIRAIAVLIVVIAHASASDKIPGGLGVSIFFFLSGFLITRLFQAERARRGVIDVPAFYLRRLLRLMPPLIITLAIAYACVLAGVVPGEFHWRTIAAQALYYFNYYNLYWQHDLAGAEGSGVLWSLAVEEHFYLFYPVFFIFLSRLRTDGARLRTLGAALVLVLAWRLVLGLLLGASSAHLYEASDARLDSILYGCLLAFLIEDGSASRLFPARPAGVAVTTAAALALLLGTLVWRDGLFRDTLRYSLQGIAFIPLFYYAVRLPALPHHHLLNTPLAVMLGTYSYAIYLSHKLIIAAFEHQFPAFTGSPATIAVAIGGSVLYAAALYRYVEAPIAALRRRLSAGAARGPAGAADRALARPV